MSDKVYEVEEGGSKLGRLVGGLLSIAMMAVAVISMFMPFVSTSTSKLTGFDFIKAFNQAEFINSAGNIPIITISYYVTLAFYYLFLVGLVVNGILTILAIIMGGEKAQSRLNKNVASLMVFLLLQALVAMNYINVVAYKTNVAGSMVTLKTSATTMFLIGAGIFFVKAVADVLLNKNLVADEIKESDSEAYSIFFKAILALLGALLPIYSTTLGRTFGFHILTLSKKSNFMSYLPLTTYTGYVLILFTVLTLVFFLASIVMYKMHRRSFTFVSRICGMSALCCIFIYGFLGFNFFFNYIETEGWGKMLTISLGTYGYIPLLMYAIFKIGQFFARIGANKVVIEYKVYANASDEEAKKAEEELKAKKKGKGKGKGKGAVKERPKVGGIGDPIPSFSEMDLKIEKYEEMYQERLGHQFENITLPELVKFVIEYAKYSREHLSYGPVEVKTFLAGLAASRLSILQGMSGTGKTSLPKIFMEAIDGECKIVAIESSWRDKNELLGYYNEFNKKYTPKTFTQYLYEASLNKEVPTLIVLDEMNLSRIEYYFSDFLSLMEAAEEKRYIKLYDVQLFPSIDERESYTALRDGHTIDIPTNVWFIGTANRDESTFEISDKVYDRAQTMNFDKRASKVVIDEEKVIPKRFVPYSVIRKLFNESKSVAFDAEKYEAIKKAEKILAPYKISFGNRVLKQIETFVNAYVACSDIKTPDDRAKFVHEAVDCILFSKVVRKLELKQITDIESLIEDFAEIKLAKSVEFLNTLKDTY